MLGKALGIMSSEELVDNSTFVMTAKLLNRITDDGLMVGGGFIATIKTTCHCTVSSTASSLIYAKADPSIADALSAELISFGDEDGIVNHIRQEGDQIILTTVMTKSIVCGDAIKVAPVCVTTISDHFQAVTKASMVGGNSMG